MDVLLNFGRTLSCILIRCCLILLKNEIGKYLFAKSVTLKLWKWKWFQMIRWNTCKLKLTPRNKLCALSIVKMFWCSAQTSNEFGELVLWLTCKMFVVGLFKFCTKRDLCQTCCLKCCLGYDVVIVQKKLLDFAQNVRVRVMRR